MAKSLFNPAENQEFINRFQQLRSDSMPQWGKMNVAQMLAHCQVPLQVTLGDIVMKRSFIGWLMGGFYKKKLIGDKPWDKGLPTDPTFVKSDDHDFESEKSKLLALIARFAEQGPAGITKGAHPLFGALTVEEWDLLQVNHLNHHLMQFGV